MSVKMKPSLFALAGIFSASLLTGCATQNAEPPFISFDQSQLPHPDVTVNIDGLGPCTDNPDRSLALNSGEPVTVLVHGCFGSSGQFRGLAQVLAFHGQQTACFTYDDRAGLNQSAAALASATHQLASQLKEHQVTVIGHSQGALITRKAFTEDIKTSQASSNAKLQLVTVSGPFSGIAAAKACGSLLMKIFSFGLIVPACNAVTGEKWADITYSSDFIRHPGKLSTEVASYLKIDTDEKGSCRKSENGKCIEDDFIFTLDEQRNASIASDPITSVMQIKAGHVEIVGNKITAPMKLISALQKSGVIHATEPQRVAAFARLLAKLYRTDSSKIAPDDFQVNKVN